MQANPPFSLKPFNTFALAHSCRELVHAVSTEQLIESCCSLYQASEPMLILGGGSNVIFCDDFNGTVVLVETKGIDITEDIGNYYLSVAAGENWHELVCFCLDHGFAGMENLALIPGTVGAAPIQNIGAYGVEMEQFCDWVEYVDLTTGEYNRLSAERCEFGYRDSIFKRQLLGKALITQVGFKLPKQWRPELEYGPLKAINVDGVTPRQVFDCICETRLSKLPDPKVLGNAGSFFKNPVIDSTKFDILSKSYPSIVGYPHGAGKTKVAAGWLIDSAGLKGFKVGGAAVHDKQALVLVNTGDATSEDVVILAGSIVEKIEQKFGITLEAEPRMIGAYGERSL
ncbi:UDP-N-acetylmuramate dehydrogenase [Shewanella schlegeliana]|uniref:UDP-N-acetylenolpyruvoylglucosamine reductase n=1 Tax=Shewanella schlegeliana TaxID=190308 RepID=A0ABS1T720_9GAMM|nr:UDP-N-acetylmuramate dehydrogenase [Shewanella schlegeliana]MBL4915587.1 UDP-N-acetylmuramate dehydrogenase [Shewanella schlegeliana]MCL1111993.1 UDP-N-acetylmuramate dehydrogenase [Shewanella schlegeliana]